MRTLGFGVTFTAREDSPAAVRAAAAGIAVTTVAQFSWRDLSALRAMRMRLQPQLIFLYGGAETTLSQFLGAGHDCKFIRVRGLDFADDWLFRLKHKLAHRHIDQIVAPGEELATRLGKAIGRRVSPIILGCDTSIFAPTAAGARSNRPTAMILGRFDPVKGHARLFEIFRRVLAQWPAGTSSPLLQVVGEPANISSPQIRAMASAAGLTENKDWCLLDRRVPNVAELMSQASLGIIPSLGSEIICRVAEEFLLCGTPVAVSGVGSLADVLFEGAGFSFCGMQEHAIADHLQNWLLRSFHEPTEDKLARAATAKEMFSIESMAAAYGMLLRRG